MIHVNNFVFAVHMSTVKLVAFPFTYFAPSLKSVTRYSAVISGVSAKRIVASQRYLAIVFDHLWKAAASTNDTSLELVIFIFFYLFPVVGNSATERLPGFKSFEVGFGE